MSLLFFLKYPEEGGGEEHRYFQPYFEGVKPKKKKVYEVKKKGGRAYAEEISLEAFAGEVFQIRDNFIQRRAEEWIVVQLILMDEL